jgi:hypothetical protein
MYSASKVPNIDRIESAAYNYVRISFDLLDHSSILLLAYNVLPFEASEKTHESPN